MKPIYLITIFIFVLSIAVPSWADEGIISSDGKLFNQTFLARGYLSYKERRSFSLSTDGGYLGPFNCSDSTFTQSAKFAGSDELCQRMRGNIFWLNLATGIFEIEYVTTQALKNIYLNGFLRINFFDEIAVVSFDESFMSYSMNREYPHDGEFLKNKTVKQFIPSVIDCSTDGLLVFDVLRNRHEYFELDENDRQDEVLKELSGNNRYPYVLVYRDDDALWSGSAKFTTGRNIYVFIGEADIRLISRVPDQLCSFHYWINQSLDYRNIEIGLRKQ